MNALPAEDIVLCPKCGGVAFVHCDIRLLDVGTNRRSSRYDVDVMACIACACAVVNIDGKFYDASALLPAETVRDMTT